MGQTQAKRVFTGSITANTDIDLSNQMPAPFDVRQSNDPIVDAKLVDTSAPGGSDLTSQGQGNIALAAGEIEVIDDQTVQLGDAVATGDMLVVTYEARDQGNLVG